MYLAYFRQLHTTCLGCNAVPRPFTCQNRLFVLLLASEGSWDGVTAERSSVQLTKIRWVTKIDTSNPSYPYKYKGVRGGPRGV